MTQPKAPVEMSIDVKRRCSVVHVLLSNGDMVLREVAEELRDIGHMV